MSWIKQKLRNWVFDCNEPESRTLSTGSVRLGYVGVESNLRASKMNFSIYPAAGGHVIEIGFRNEKKDSYETRLHIAGVDEDLGQRIAEIITFENLRN